MSALIGAFCVTWAFGAFVGLFASAVTFGVAQTDEERGVGAVIARVALIWPFWVGAQVFNALRWNR